MSLALDHLRRDLAPIVRAIIADVGRRMTPAVVEARAFERLAKIVRGGDELPAERYRRENAGAIAEMEQLGNSRDAAMIVARRRSDNPHTQEMLAQRFRGLRRKKKRIEFV
ncbi:hypothetical protein FFI89_017320 [Bradyrhizobium sp. KBS0727]|uniref:hypothetical protein n=1 Tax=unclassified Bradyrhizobium TaxID=2631580 RepID=UPI00110D5469|nr:MULTISPECIES: hypothetical protein [unclassified Bradyrhizobium]QDW38748.1 hypothetical protein FFI71_017315 [Bradyrhizobium sp. KBS0725]QDW45352.1 hypothetical protein FFI89_017320 [Bradyrhizobium sp. KBS0727]